MYLRSTRIYVYIYVYISYQCSSLKYYRTIIIKHGISSIPSMEGLVLGSSHGCKVPGRVWCSEQQHEDGGRQVSFLIRNGGCPKFEDMGIFACRSGKDKAWDEHDLGFQIISSNAWLRRSVGVFQGSPSQMSPLLLYSLICISIIKEHVQFPSWVH